MSFLDHDPYPTINGLMRAMGVEPVLRAGCVTPVLPYARPAKFGISQPEVAEALERMKDFDDWPSSWEASAMRYEAFAKACATQNQRITAKAAYVHTSYLYHLAQLYARDPEAKARLQGKSVETYRAGGQFFEPPLECVKVKYEEFHIPGYLRLPAAQSRTPWVLLTDGADSTKEEAHFQAEAFLERGLGVFYFDGPGQGELRRETRLVLGDYEKAVSQVITTLTQIYSLLDPDRIGVYGISTGGYLALRSAAHDARLKAIASVGGFYDARGFFESPVSTQKSMASMFGIKNASEMARFIKEKIDLKDVVPTLRRPLLVIHGGRDHLVPDAEIDDLAKAAGDLAQVRVFRQGTHALQNVDHVVCPVVADWMATALIENRQMDLNFLDEQW
ncbi:MAG: prolyl oligopeptidase family serine peptidase [Deltaproteobacteria bacterium]|nr:prolyl oligopeptidase family serine peptidase [Deltaproteobacteria bacterium]MDZ4344279.1 prolyl oligopeptidase family serine peptidase [Candidatus Binatia bacterium]